MRWNTYLIKRQHKTFGLSPKPGVGGLSWEKVAKLIMVALIPNGENGHTYLREILLVAD
jgi:hypothetical protein